MRMRGMEQGPDLEIVCAGCGQTLVYHSFHQEDKPGRRWPDNPGPLMHGDHQTGHTYDREHFAYVLDRAQPPQRR